MKLTDKRRSDYQAYLLRLWREGTRMPWHASLQSTSKEQIYHFATIEALFAFLDARLVEDVAPANREPGPLEQEG
jgi:hypothetical protein